MNLITGDTPQIIEACRKAGLLRNQTAYVLATVKHETGGRMKPVAENLNYSASGLRKTFSKYFTPAQAQAYARQPIKIANRAYANRMGNGPENSGDGWRYRGRGYVQITGKNNYTKYGIVNNPDKALEAETAAHILVDGMKYGRFTNKKLSHYITLKASNFVQARRIINGLDKASTIANYARTYDLLLVPEFKKSYKPTQKPVQKLPVKPSPVPPAKPRGFLGWLLAIAKTLFSGGQR